MTSDAFLSAQARVLKAFQSGFKQRIVSNLNTISSLHSQSSTHILLIHGWGAGIGIWCRNWNALTPHHNVHAIDLLGWGGSARTKFPSCTAREGPLIAQQWYVDSIEKWRQEMKIDKLFVVGFA